MHNLYLIIMFVVVAVSVIGSFVGFGVWLIRKNLGPTYHVAGVGAIVLGSLAGFLVTAVAVLYALTS